MYGSTLTAGYPVHAVKSYRSTPNPHGVIVTQWTAVCGHADTKVGHRPFGRAGTARRAELCPICFPAGHATYVPAPTREG